MLYEVITSFSIAIEGDFTAPEQFIGALSGSSYDTFETMIFPTEVGTKNGIVVCKFEDSSGKMQRFEQPFTVEIMEGGDMMDPNMGGEIPADMQMDNPKKSNKM